MHFNYSSKIIILLIILIAFAVRLPALSEKSFGTDETATLQLLDLPFNELFSAIAVKELGPPLYFVTVNSVFLFLKDIFWVRMVSVMFGVAVVFLTYLLAKKLFNEKHAFLSMVFLAVNPLAIFYSQHMRLYSMLIFFFLLYFYFLYEYLKYNNKKHLILISLCSVLLLYTSYVSAIAIAASWIYIFFEKRAALRNTIAASLAGFIAVIPWVLFSSQQFVRTATMENTGDLFIGSVYALYKFAVGLNMFYVTEVAIYLLVVLPIVILLFLYSIFTHVKNKRLSLPVFFVVPIILSYFVGLFVGKIFWFRYFVYILPLFIFFVANSIVSMKSRKSAVIFSALIIAFWLFIDFVYYSSVLHEDFHRISGL